MALGFAVAALAAPVAQARVDEGVPGQPNSAAEVAKSITYKSFVTDFPSVQASVNASDYGMPRAMPADYAVSNGDQIEVVRADPPGQTLDSIGSQASVVRADPPGQTLDKIGVVSQPQSISEPQVVSAGFDWSDAAIGAGLALALVLLAGGAAVATRHLGREQTA